MPSIVTDDCAAHVVVSYFVVSFRTLSLHTLLPDVVIYDHSMWRQRDDSFFEIIFLKTFFVFVIFHFYLLFVTS